ncbi:MAG: hypothetical protein ACKO15_03225 [Burkholderiales bacterium]|nr:hypothetical protein [Rhodocyclaceae bacterium]
MNTSNSTLVEADRQNLKKRDERLFQVLFLISFPIFLVIVLATRLVPAASDAKKHPSILVEASHQARSTLAMALMD